MKDLPIVLIQSVNILQTNHFRKQLQSLEDVVLKDENAHLISMEENFFKEFIHSHSKTITSMYINQPYHDKSFQLLWFNKFIKGEFSFVDKSKSEKANSFNSLSNVMEPFLKKIDFYNFSTFRFNKTIYVEFLSQSGSEFRAYLKEYDLNEKTIYRLCEYMTLHKEEIKKFLSEENS